MPAAVLALDQGTTGSTALAFSHEGRVLGRAHPEFDPSSPQPGWVEHDREEIWQVSRRVMKEALDAAGVGPGELRAIGVTNQRETTVLWERKTGRPVHPAIVWQSRQTADICEGLRREGHEAIFRERTGLVLDPSFSGTKVRWILDRCPGTRGAAAGGDVLFGTIDTWLLFRLPGGAVHATDPTNASRTLLFDIHERRWDPRLLEILDIPPAMLPEVRPSSGFFGETAPESGLPVGVPVTGIAGDQQAALFGQGCWEPGLAKNTYGTGCFVMMNMGGKRLKSTGGLLATLCCDATGKPAYALEGSIFIPGPAFRWRATELGLIGNAAETEAIAAGLKDTGGVYVVPAFAGLGAPYWDMGAPGAIVGLTRGAGRRQLVRATLESIAYQTRDVRDGMNVESGIPAQELRVDGGGAANGFLIQFQADMLGVPVDRPALVETTAAGAAFLAGLGVGFWENPEVLRGVRRRERLFQPQMTEGEREKLYAGWKRAVQ